jgi:hypothetical protein
VIANCVLGRSVWQTVVVAVIDGIGQRVARRRDW